MAGPEALERLGGVVPILPTPLTADGEIDEAGVRHLVRFCAEEGMEGALVLGSNGEFPYLGSDEKTRVMAAAVEGADGRIPVIGGASACGTREAIAQAREARRVGCAAVLAALPGYFALRIDDALEHYRALAGEGGIPIVYYHFAEVTGLALSPDEVARIAAIDGVVGCKLTVANERFLASVVDRTPGWSVLTGTSFLFDAALACGGAGLFCPLPLVAPAEVRAVMDARERGDAEQAVRRQRELLRAMPLFSGMDASPAVQALGFRLMSRLPYRGPGRRVRPTHGLLKEALRLAGHPITNVVRRPYRAVTPKQSAAVRRTLEQLGWLDRVKAGSAPARASAAG